MCHPEKKNRSSLKKLSLENSGLAAFRPFVDFFEKKLLRSKKKEEKKSAKKREKKFRVCSSLVYVPRRDFVGVLGSRL